MPVKVVDASVLAAFLFGEPRQEKAETLISDINLYAPTLLPYELTNVAFLKMERYPEQQKKLKTSLKTGLQLPDLTLVDVEYEEVLSLAFETDLTAYDASYLLLSRMLSVPLITFDQKLNAVADSD